MSSGGGYRRGRAQQQFGRRRFIGVAAGLGGGLAAGMLSACGGRAPATSSSSAGSGPAAASGGTPRTGGVLSLLQANNPPSLDPNGSSSAYEHQLLGQVCSRLMQFKTGPTPATAENRELVPDLALSAESADALTWTVKLRSGATFHNMAPVNGHTVEAEDVKASFTRTLLPSNPNRAVFDSIDANQITTPDKQTVVFKLKYAYAPFPILMTSSFGWILPREALAGSYDPAKTVIGSGPFLFDHYTPDVEFVTKRNPNYYVKDQPYVDGIRMAIVPDVASAEAQFASGHVDYLSGIPVPDFPMVSGNNPKAAVIKTRGTDNFYLYSQLRDPSNPFQDIRIRRAVSLAIDRQALGKAVLGSDFWLNPVTGLGFGKWSLTPDQMPGDVAQWLKYNPQQAKQLLQAAGVTNLTLKFNETKPQPRGDNYYKTAETVYSMLSANLPWKITLVAIDYNKDWVNGGKGVRYGNFPTDTIGLSGLEQASDVDDYLYGHFYSKSTKSVEGLNNATIDSLVDKERATANTDDRVKAALAIQQELAAQLWCISDFADTYGYALRQPWVQNWNVSASYGAATETYAKIWLTR